MTGWPRSPWRTRRTVRWSSTSARSPSRRSRSPRGRPSTRSSLHVDVPASPAETWRAWTDPAVVRRWWAPEHFEVAEAAVEPWVGGRWEITLREGDGALHRAAGRARAVEPLRRLEVELVAARSGRGSGAPRRPGGAADRARRWNPGGPHDPALRDRSRGRGRGRRRTAGLGADIGLARANASLASAR
ncbi:SRPBCC domain-containing protein [Nocardioides sp. W3-2-3]|nr:SRPBCC domain-containing protein [Nocardioides convexus]